MAELILATAYDDDFAPMGDIAATRLRAWAERLGAKVHVERKLTIDRPPAWNKVVLIRTLLSQGHDWVVWVDADALVRRLDGDLRTEIREGKDLYLSLHHQWVHPMPGMAVRFEVPNTGVMLLRRSDWTLDFLERVWAADQWITHPWWENAAVIDLMGYHRLLESSAVNAPRAEIMGRVHWLDWSWNSVPGECNHPDPHILHYTRRGNFEERLAEMRAALTKIEAVEKGSPP
jgi:hypothetical protein